MSPEAGGYGRSITAVTTVGYGEPAVTTDGGRIIAIFLMVTGIGFVAVMTGTAAERFVRNRRKNTQRRASEERLDQIIARLDSLEPR
jgi:voltage-gated potassium channel